MDLWWSGGAIGELWGLGRSGRTVGSSLGVLGVEGPWVVIDLKGL